MNRLIITLVIGFLVGIQPVYSQDTVYCDHIFQVEDTLRLEDFQDTVSYSYNYTASNAGISGGFYISQFVALDDYSVIDSISIDYGLELNTYIYSTQTYLFELDYATSFIPENYSVTANYTVRGPVGTCMFPFTLLFPQSVGINNSIVEDVKTYPNPAQGSFTLDLQRVYKQIRVNVRDFAGRLLFSEDYKSANKIAMNLSEIKGLVLIEVETEAERTVIKQFLQ